jgi:hypothetical protein
MTERWETTSAPRRCCRRRTRPVEVTRQRSANLECETQGELVCGQRSDGHRDERWWSSPARHWRLVVVS